MTVDDINRMVFPSSTLPPIKRKISSSHEVFLNFLLLLRVGGFSCSLYVFLGGNFLDRKKCEFFPTKILQYLVFKSMDPYPHMDPDPDQHRKKTNGVQHHCY
jgi:hypothetical protein